MNAMRFGVGFLFAVFAANAGTPVTAQDLRQPLLEASSGQTDLSGCFRPSWNDACPSVYGHIDALFMRRDPRFARQPIVVDASTNTTVLSTSDLNFHYDPGLRATIGIRRCEGRALEFSYFGLFQGSAFAAVERPNEDSFLIFPDNLSGNVFVDMDRVRVDYSSWLHSFEMNLPCCRGCCSECGSGCSSGCGSGCGSASGCREVRCQSVEWFAGFRYLNLGERLDLSAQRTVNAQIEDGTYNIRTTNNLYGAQLGARLRRTRNRFGWEATGKAGVFGYDAQQTQSVTDFPDFPLRPTVSSSGSGVAFVGEVNLSALYRLTDIWGLRAGYSVMWIEGLALAPDQFDFAFATSPSGNQLHHGGGMLLHGANVGLEARW